MGVSETIVVASYLEPELVERIRAAWDGPVLFEPQLVPRPRYVADHGGDKPQLDAVQEARWRDLLGQAEICFDFDWWQPGALLENSPKLSWVQATSAGIGGFVRRYGLDRSDVEFTTAAGTHAVPLAEFALASALYFVKGVPHLLAQQHDHRWQRYTTRSLAGRAVTVVGLGAIGRQVVETFAAMGARVTGVARPGGRRPETSAAEVVDADHLDDVLPVTDVLVLATPLTDATTGLMGAGRLALLPADAVLVNIARGPVLDHVALLEQLAGGRLGGAALDVTDPEPLPPDSPLWDLPNVLISPHSASTVDRENAVLVELFVDNLARRRDGRPLRNVYSRELGY